MATWQFDFHLVPQSAVERHFGSIPVTIPEAEYDQLDWWKGIDPQRQFRDDLSTLLPKTRSWDPGQEKWGAEDGDRFDVLLEDERIAEVYGRLDVRNLSLPFLNRVIEVAARHGLLLVTEGRHVLRPSVKELLTAIRRSPGFEYVSDPERFLHLLAESK